MEKEDARNQGAKKARCADKKREERLHAGRALAQALQRAGGVWEREVYTALQAGRTAENQLRQGQAPRSLQPVMLMR